MLTISRHQDAVSNIRQLSPLLSRLASLSFQIFWQNVYYDRQPPAFDARYENIVWHTTEEYPGFKTPTIEVDVMFQIVSINECMSF